MPDVFFLLKHGMGIKNVLKVIEKYGGSYRGGNVKSRNQNKEFIIFQVVIPLGYKRVTEITNLE